MSAREGRATLLSGMVPSRSTMVQQIVPHCPYVDSINWTQWVKKKEKKKGLEVGRELRSEGGSGMSYTEEYN